jgi:hypothetical protein
MTASETKSAVLNSDFYINQHVICRQSFYFQTGAWQVKSLISFIKEALLEKIRHHRSNFSLFRINKVDCILHLLHSP